MKLILFNKEQERVEIHYGVGFALLFGAYFLGSMLYLISNWISKAMLNFTPLAGLALLGIGIGFGYLFRAAYGPRYTVCHNPVCHDNEE